MTCKWLCQGRGFDGSDSLKNHLFKGDKSLIRVFHHLLHILKNENLKKIYKLLQMRSFLSSLS